MRIVDPREPGFGSGEVAALLGRLRQQQPGLGQRLGGGGRIVTAGGVTAAAAFAGGGRRRLHQLHEALQRGLGGLWLAQFDVQRAQRQPGRRQVGLGPRDDLELRDGVGITMQVDQGAGIGATHGEVGVRRRQSPRHHRLGFGAGGHQFERQQQRRVRLGILGVRLLREPHRAIDIAGGQPGTPDRAVDGSAGGGSRRIRLQHLFEQSRRLLLVADAGDDARQPADQAFALRRRGGGQQGLQRFGQLRRAVHRQQDLQLQPQRVQRLGVGGAPGTRGRQRLVAGACVQRDLGGTAKQLLVARAPRGVKQDLIGVAGMAAAKLDLADQQLIEQRCVEVRVEHRRLGRCLGRRRGGGGGLGQRGRTEEQAGRGRDSCACGTAPQARHGH